MKNDDDGGDDLMSTVIHNICAWKRSEGICILRTVRNTDMLFL